MTNTSLSVVRKSVLFLPVSALIAGLTRSAGACPDDEFSICPSGSTVVVSNLPPPPPPPPPLPPFPGMDPGFPELPGGGGGGDSIPSYFLESPEHLSELIPYRPLPWATREVDRPNAYLGLGSQNDVERVYEIDGRAAGALLLVQSQPGKQYQHAAGTCRRFQGAQVDAVDLWPLELGAYEYHLIYSRYSYPDDPSRIEHNISAILSVRDGSTNVGLTSSWLAPKESVAASERSILVQARGATVQIADQLARHFFGALGASGITFDPPSDVQLPAYVVKRLSLDAFHATGELMPVADDLPASLDVNLTTCRSQAADSCSTSARTLALAGNHFALDLGSAVDYVVEIEKNSQTVDSVYESGFKWSPFASADVQLATAYECGASPQAGSLAGCIEVAASGLDAGFAGAVYGKSPESLPLAGVVDFKLDLRASPARFFVVKLEANDGRQFRKSEYVGEQWQTHSFALSDFYADGQPYLSGTDVQGISVVGESGPDFELDLQNLSFETPKASDASSLPGSSEAHGSCACRLGHAQGRTWGEAFALFGLLGLLHRRRAWRAKTRSIP